MSRKRIKPGPVRLPPRRRWLVNGVGLGVWASGVLWLVFHYFLQTKGDLGPEPSLLEPWWLKLHAAFAFVAIWTLGLLWGVHVASGWGQGRRRLSGGGLLAVMGALIVTGYLLYYAGSDEVRSGVSIFHWTVGLALPALYLVHRLAASRRRRGSGQLHSTIADPRGRKVFAAQEVSADRRDL